MGWSGRIRTSLVGIVVHAADLIDDRPARLGTERIDLATKRVDGIGAAAQPHPDDQRDHDRDGEDDDDDDHDAPPLGPPSTEATVEGSTRSWASVPQSAPSAHTSCFQIGAASLSASMA